MTQEEFKNLYLVCFTELSNATLDYYIEEGNKLLANAVAIDPVVINIIDTLQAERERRG